MCVCVCFVCVLCVCVCVCVCVFVCVRARPYMVHSSTNFLNYFFQATRHIREWENKRVGQSYYIVALTAHANQTDVQDCLAAGMDRY